MSYSVEVGLPTACPLERGFSDLKPVPPLVCALFLSFSHVCCKYARPTLDTGRGSVISMVFIEQLLGAAWLGLGCGQGGPSVTSLGQQAA